MKTVKVCHSLKDFHANEKTCLKLELLDKKISGDELETLVTALKGNTTLERLFLCGNNLGDAGAHTLIEEGLKDNTTLRVLNLWWNNITTLPASVVSLKGLEELWLCGNPLVSLPKEIGECTKLISLLLDNTSKKTLKSPPYEVAIQGVASFKEYFAKLEKGMIRMKYIKSFFISLSIFYVYSIPVSTFIRTLSITILSLLALSHCAFSCSVIVLTKLATPVQQTNLEKLLFLLYINYIL